jgi:hypothetical protein
LKVYNKISDFLDQVLKPFVVDECIDDPDGMITKKSAISIRIGMMIAAFPNCAPPSPENYMQTVVGHINDCEPDPYVLESTCREVERTRKFPPMPAEILPVLEMQSELWSERWSAINSVSRLKRSNEFIAKKETN